MLFGRKRKPDRVRLAMWRADVRMLCDERITALRFAEARVIQLSIEFCDAPAEADT